METLVKEGIGRGGEKLIKTQAAAEDSEKPEQQPEGIQDRQQPDTHLPQIGDLTQWMEQRTALEPRSQSCPPLPLRVEESTKDGYGAVADAGKVPAFLFRNCGHSEAEAIVEILNSTPALLDEVDRLQRTENEPSEGSRSESLTTVDESDPGPSILTDLNRLMKDASSLIKDRGWRHSSWQMQPKPSDQGSPEPKWGPLTFFGAISECASDQVEYGLAIIFLDADGENGGWLADEGLSQAKVLRRLGRTAKPASMVKCMGPDWEQLVAIAKARVAG